MYWIMSSLHQLSDDDIDALLLLLFTGQNLNQSQRQHQSRQQAAASVPSQPSATNIRDLSNEDLLRIRSRNHPDKWPHVNQVAYQAAVEELDRRRRRR